MYFHWASQTLLKNSRYTVATASATSGVLPFTRAVTFSASGSVDTDGTIASYLWTFGDGTTGTGVSVSHTYTGSVPTTFSVTVRTTDNLGASTTSAPLAIAGRLTARVAGLAMSKTTSSGSKPATFATAVVTIQSSTGGPLSGATVTGTWSGLTSGTATGTTGTTGVVTFKSGSTKTRGTFTFTVTGVSKAGYDYVPSTNTVSAASITW